MKRNSIRPQLWAHGAVGSALPLQGRGLQFDSGCVQAFIFILFRIYHPLFVIEKFKGRGDFNEVLVDSGHSG